MIGSWAAVFRMVIGGWDGFALRGVPWPAQVFTVFSARCSVFARMCSVFGQMCPVSGQMCPLFPPICPKCVHSARACVHPEPCTGEGWRAESSEKSREAGSERGRSGHAFEGEGLLPAAQGYVAVFVQVQAVELAGEVGAVGLADVGHELPVALARRVVLRRDGHHAAVERHDLGGGPGRHPRLDPGPDLLVA